MKQLILHVVINLLFWGSALCQYKPMAVEGAHWIMFALSDTGTAHHVILIKGDTLLNGKPFKKVYRQNLESGATLLSEFLPPYLVKGQILLGAIRDDAAEEKVSGVSFNPSAWVLADCSVFEEQLLHDFSLVAGDTLNGCLHAASGTPDGTVDSVGNEFLWGQQRRVMHSNYSDLIEGIGTETGPFQAAYALPAPGNPSLLVDYCLGTDEGCGIQLFSGTGEAGDDRIRVFPNPTGGLLYVDAGQRSGRPLTVVIQDMMGTTVLSQNLALPRSGAETLDLKGLAAGVYVLTVVSDDWEVTEKLIVR